MTRTRIAAAAVLTLGLLAPVAVATSASAAPQTCSDHVLLKDHKINKGLAKKKGLNKPTFVHAGRVTAVDTTGKTVSFVVRGGQNKAIRGCVLTVLVTDTTKIRRNDNASTLADIQVGDHVNVKGTSARGEGDNVVYTAKRIAASGHQDHPDTAHNG